MNERNATTTSSPVDRQGEEPITTFTNLSNVQTSTEQTTAIETTTTRSPATSPNSSSTQATTPSNQIRIILFINRILTCGKNTKIRKKIS